MVLQVVVMVVVFVDVIVVVWCCGYR